MVYVGTYALIYLHTILGERIVSRDGLPRGVLPSGILKMRKNVQALKFGSPQNDTELETISWELNMQNPLFNNCVGVWVRRQDAAKIYIKRCAREFHIF